MADILIRKVSDAAKERLSKAAAQAGASLEAFLRQRLEQIAQEAPQPNDEGQPFGTWAAGLFAEIDPSVREEFVRALEEIEDTPPPDIKPFGED
jgi:plasmid stability protein